MAELADLTIAEAAQAIRERELSPVELTEACLSRAARWEPVVGAFVRLEPEVAIRQAHVLTEELTRGEHRGPLHGVPVAIKDVIDVRGVPTTAASRVLDGEPAPDDAPVVARLRARGAVLVGKTNTQEFAYGVITPGTANPWDRSRIPGGSSGGSAAAVAVRASLGALGTDTAGSVRIPAALCGVSGLKPTRGAVPMAGIIPLAPNMDVCGPIAGTARDLAILWEAMSGDRSALPEGRADVTLGAPEASSEVVETEPEVASAVEATVDTLVGLGARRVPADLPPFAEWDEPRTTVLMHEALEVHRRAGWYPGRADRYTEETRGYLERATPITLQDVSAARRVLAPLEGRLLEAFDAVDVLVLPTTPIVAPTMAEAARTTPTSRRRPVVGKLTRICGPVNWCGLAAATIPCGVGEGNLPIGVQFVARDESTALDVAIAFQSATQFHMRAPPWPSPADPGSA